MYGVIEGTGFEAIDPSFNECLIGHAPGRALVDRRPLVRGASMARGWAVSCVVRYPKQSDAAL